MVEVEILKQKGHNFLWVDDYLWMWDIPSEQIYQRKIAEKSFGDVLIAGYGLGLVQRYLVQNPLVKSILTVEKYPEVIDACRKVYGEIHGDININDFYDFNPRRKYDCILGDLWKDQEEQFLPDYLKFKDKARTLVKPHGKILAWGESFFENLIRERAIS